MNPKPFDAPPPLQALSVQGARLCLALRDVMASHELAPHAGAPLVAAFSGGADSTALVAMLHCLGFPLILAHLDHQLRPESAAEAVHAQQVAQTLGYPCMVRARNVAELARHTGTGLEEAGRVARYAFLEEVRQHYSAPWILTGHQQDDLCEDLLLRLVRGAGWPALAGMDEIQPQRHLLRPLLGFGHAQLVEWLHKAGVPWLEDASNAGDAFKRNRIRRHVLPLLMAENPSFPRAVRDLWRLAREDETYWNDLLIPALETVNPVPDGFFLPHKTLTLLPRAARLRLYLRVIQKLHHGQARCDTLFLLDGAWQRHIGGKQFKLPGGNTVLLSRNGLRFIRPGNLPACAHSDASVLPCKRRFPV